MLFLNIHTVRTSTEQTTGSLATSWLEFGEKARQAWLILSRLGLETYVTDTTARALPHDGLAHSSQILHLILAILTAQPQLCELEEWKEKFPAYRVISGSPGHFQKQVVWEADLAERRGGTGTGSGPHAFSLSIRHSTNPILPSSGIPLVRLPHETCGPQLPCNPEVSFGEPG